MIFRLALVLAFTIGCRTMQVSDVSASRNRQGPDNPRPLTKEEAMELAEKQESGSGLESIFTPGCFEKHLIDAAALNLSRRDHYAKLSGGRTTSISNSLVFGERVSRVVAKYFDLRGEWYQKRGVPIICTEFIDMIHAPKLADNSVRPGPIPSFLRTLKANEFEGAALDAWNAEGVEGIAKFAEIWLSKFQANAAYYCMTIHLLESIARGAHFAPIHVATAKKLGLGWYPDDLANELIKIQIKQLAFAIDLDQKTVEIHRDGIPIVCQDVPPISIN